VPAITSVDIHDHEDTPGSPPAVPEDAIEVDLWFDGLDVDCGGKKGKISEGRFIAGYGPYSSEQTIYPHCRVHIDYRNGVPWATQHYDLTFDERSAGPKDPDGDNDDHDYAYPRQGHAYNSSQGMVKFQSIGYSTSYGLSGTSFLRIDLNGDHGTSEETQGPCLHSYGGPSPGFYPWLVSANTKFRVLNVSDPSFSITPTRADFAFSVNGSVYAKRLVIDDASPATWDGSQVFADASVLTLGGVAITGALLVKDNTAATSDYAGAIQTVGGIFAAKEVMALRGLYGKDVAGTGRVQLVGQQEAYEAPAPEDASESHSVTGTDTVDQSDLESALNALGGKINDVAATLNSLLEKLGADAGHGLLAGAPA
jgi:hypothetical protein